MSDFELPPYEKPSLSAQIWMWVRGLWWFFFKLGWTGGSGLSFCDKCEQVVDDCICPILEEKRDDA